MYLHIFWTLFLNIFQFAWNIISFTQIGCQIERPMSWFGQQLGRTEPRRRKHIENHGQIYLMKSQWAWVFSNRKSNCTSQNTMVSLGRQLHWREITRNPVPSGKKKPTFWRFLRLSVVTVLSGSEDANRCGVLDLFINAYHHKSTEKKPSENM